MRKIIFIMSIISTAFLALAGCVQVERQGKEIEGENQPWLRSLEVYSAAANPENIYHVAYPYSYYAFSADGESGGRTERLDLTDSMKIEDLMQDKEVFWYLTDYVEGLPETQEGQNLSYYIILRYLNEEGKEENIYRRGYDFFPEGWGEFIEQYNGICGGELLCGGGTLQTVTPRFLMEAFGVAEADVREGTLQDVIDVQKLDIVKVADSFRMEDALSGYYAAVKEPLIASHRPTELISVESTQEEYDAFLDSFFDRLEEIQVEERESDQEYLRHFCLIDTGKCFYTARTSDLDKLPAVGRGGEGCYVLELDAHMEGMTMNTDFIYSGDGRFLLVPMDCGTDVITAFCEIE